jgi:hypothetical protein
MSLERLLIAFLLFAQDTTPTRPLFPALPEGNNGIAAKYLGDVGIDRDPSVVLFDDFEGSAVRFDNNWGGIVLTPKTENVHGGKQAMECAIGYPRKDKGDRLGVNHHFKEGYDTRSCGTTRSSGRTPTCGTAEPRRRRDRRGRSRPARRASPAFPRTDAASMEPARHLALRGEGRLAGHLATYTYHRSSVTSGANISSRRGRIAPYGDESRTSGRSSRRGRTSSPTATGWICYELMVKANTPGQARRPHRVLGRWPAHRRLHEPAAARRGHAEVQPRLARSLIPRTT